MGPISKLKVSNGVLILTGVEFKCLCGSDQFEVVQNIVKIRVEPIDESKSKVGMTSTNQHIFRCISCLKRVTQTDIQNVGGKGAEQGEAKA